MISSPCRMPKKACTRSMTRASDGTIQHPLPTKELDSNPVQIVLSDTEIFKFRMVEVYMLVSRAWRIAQELDQSYLFLAGLSAKACLHNSHEEARCLRCIPDSGKLISIEVSTRCTTHGRAPDILECYQFRLRSHCTSSRDHLGDSLVLRIDNLVGSRGIYSSPFRLLARVHFRKKEPVTGNTVVPSEIPRFDLPETPRNVDAERDTGGTCQKEILLLQQSPQLLVHLDFQPLTVASTKNGAELGVIVRLVKHSVAPIISTKLTMNAFQFLRATFGDQFIKIEYVPLTNGFCITVASFRTPESAQRGLQIFHHYLSNTTLNGLGIDFLSTAIITPVWMVPSW